ncbi:MAG: hypothetical protein SPF19_11635 [Oliverpabstia sp.]|nr:hypothetical protein [Oliverpabstia sp.]
MIKISNLEEKQLLIARYFIDLKEKGQDYQDKDILELWNKYFPGDFKLSKKKYRYQSFIYKEGSACGCLTLPDTKYIPKYLIAIYNKLWDNCCTFVNNYIATHILRECDKELTKLRKYHQNIIKRRCSGIHFYGSINNWHINRLCTYCVYAYGESYTGNYEKCLKFIEQKKYERQS